MPTAQFLLFQKRHVYWGIYFLRDEIQRFKDILQTVDYDISKLCYDLQYDRAWVKWLERIVLYGFGANLAGLVVSIEVGRQIRTPNYAALSSCSS